VFMSTPNGSVCIHDNKERVESSLRGWQKGLVSTHTHTLSCIEAVECSGIFVDTFAVHCLSKVLAGSVNLTPY